MSEIKLTEDQQFEKDRMEARHLNQIVQDKIPKMKEALENQKGYHEDAVKSIEDLLEALENKNHIGNSLPLEYMDLSDTTLWELIHDWTSLSEHEDSTRGDQNENMISETNTIKDFYISLNNFKESYGKTH